ncbi:hypothetical protein [Streptomyces atriruber]|uniref:hypothetical protein n=1 Tax=Streptomyces atriruber TaxID=545121 RepID=UPI0012FE7FA7|nr:hypothetical protein [Streptomyces atriruber]
MRGTLQGAQLVSGRAVDPQEARQLMLRNGCRPKTAFRAAKEAWPSTCERCGADIGPTYDSISSKARKHGDAPRGCRACADRARAEKYRLDEAELARTITKANIKLLEPYTNNRTRVQSICLNEGCPRQGKPIKVLVKAVRGGAMACKYCAQRAIDPDVAVAIMRDQGLVEPSSAYKRVDEPWPGVCQRCLCPVQPRLHDVMRGQGACIFCAPNTPLTKQQAWDRALSYRFRPHDPDAFKGTNTLWAGTCMDCLTPVNPCLGNLYRGQGACNSRSCKLTGFKDTEPGLVYLVHRNSDPAMAKIGICEDSARNTRLKVHQRNGWEVAYTRPFAVGLHARLVEGAVKRLWFTERGWSNGAARGEDRSDGYTETVLLDDPTRDEPWALLTPLALWTDAMVEAERLGFDLDEQRSDTSES